MTENDENLYKNEKNMIDENVENHIGGFAPRRRNANPKMDMDYKSFSIEDFLKGDHQNNSIKTPVSFLQELLSRKGITPNYELVQIEGAIHEPTFRYRVAFVEKDTTHTSMGAGRSKKEAKHAAAKGIIEKILGGNILNKIGNTMKNESLNGDISMSNSTIDIDDNIKGNPIGLLQETCMARRWPPPNYETETEDGLPHERQFTIACSVLKYREIGTGKSKKVAKRLAAYKMWKKLKEHPLDSTQIVENLDEGGDYERVSSINRYTDLKDTQFASMKDNYSQKASLFHKTLKTSSGNKILKLQTICLADPAVNYISILKEISEEQQFKVAYVEIEESTHSGGRQCLIQLSTHPVAVCHGSGKNFNEAKSNAARNALEYLKVMTKT